MSSPRRSASLTLWQGHKYAVNGATSMRLKSVLSSRCSLLLSLPFFSFLFPFPLTSSHHSRLCFFSSHHFSPFWPHSSSLCMSLLFNLTSFSYPLPVFFPFPPLPFLLYLYFSCSFLQSSPFSVHLFFSLSFLSTLISINPFCSVSRSQHAPAPSLSG